MKKRIVYEDLTEINGEPIGELRTVPDFLPSPSELAGKVEQVKVTLALEKRSLAFFKKQAKRYKTSYQRMIRNLLAAYARRSQL